jgi:hypothetical protein
MPKYGPDEVVVEFDNSAGTLQDMTQYVYAINGVKINAQTQETTPFGASWVAKAFVGVKSGDDITVEGFYDDTAVTGPHAIFNDVGATRTFKVTWGNSKYTSMETIIKEYSREPVKGELTKYTVTLEVDGQITDA